MDCEEISEDVIVFCKKEIETLENTTIVNNPQSDKSLNALCGLRDAYETVIDRIAIKERKNDGVGRAYQQRRGAYKAPYHFPLNTSGSKA